MGKRRGQIQLAIDEVQTDINKLQDVMSYLKSVQNENAIKKSRKPKAEPPRAVPEHKVS